MFAISPAILTAAQPDMINMSTLNASIVAVLGYALVFFGLILLMGVIALFGMAFSASAKKKTVEKPVVTVKEEVPQPVAPGTAGQLKLYNVEPKTAAMLMAIVANKMGKPLNELRFISIKEVE